MRLFKLIILFMLIPTLCFGGIDPSGDADYLNLADGIVADDEDTTMCVWVTLDSTASEQRYITRGRDGSGNGWSFSLGFDSAEGAFFADGVYSSTYKKALHNDTSITTGVPYLVCGRIDLGAEIRVWVNGETCNPSPNCVVGFSSPMRSSSVGYDIARINASYYTGFNLHEIYIWGGTASLDDVEIKHIYNSKVKGIGIQFLPSYLRVYLPLDDYPEGYGTWASTTWKDLSGNGNDASGYDADNDSDVVAEEVLTYP